LRELVAGEEGGLVRGRIRVLSGSRGFQVLLHAKIVISDGEKGYMGSANLSWSGLDENFELGLSLSGSQASAIDALVASLEAQGFLEDHTRSALDV